MTGAAEAVDVTERVAQARATLAPFLADEAGMAELRQELIGQLMSK